MNFLYFLLFSTICFANSSNWNAAYVLAPEYRTDGLGVPANVSIAIATTILNPGPSLPMWLDYHLRWVQHIVIYMDDPGERHVFYQLCGDRPVTLFEGSRVEPQMTPESRLIRRQMANMRHAIPYLTEQNYTWLLHIDVDELLFGSLVDSGGWARNPEIGLVTFTNHEALPVDFETLDPFRDCMYFWVNGIDHNANFLAYGNGKSAVRLGPTVEPRGAHSFAGHVGSTLRPSGEEAMVLHYPYPSYSTWLRKFKYYDKFSDHWFGDRQAPKIMNFMLRSRDVIQQALKTEDWTITESFFSQRVLNLESRTDAMSQGRIRRYTPFADQEEV